MIEVANSEEVVESEDHVVGWVFGRRGVQAV